MTAGRIRSCRASVLARRTYQIIARPKKRAPYERPDSLRPYELLTRKENATPGRKGVRGGNLGFPRAVYPMSSQVLPLEDSKGSGSASSVPGAFWWKRLAII